MNKRNLKIKQAQRILLDAFAENAGSFALAGGTALELYYLKHRFSADLDFFSSEYSLGEIDGIVSGLKRSTGGYIKLESEFVAENHARVRFYSALLKGLKETVKIDFVEDVIFKHPSIRSVNDVPIYSIENIYLQKAFAITGTRPSQDNIGRQIMRGRAEARDAFDIYVLSRKIQPLYLFLKKAPVYVQRGMVHWYRSFSRHDLKMALLDLDIYDKGFDGKEMITYLEKQIEKFIGEVLEK